MTAEQFNALTREDFHKRAAAGGAARTEKSRSRAHKRVTLARTLAGNLGQLTLFS